MTSRFQLRRANASAWAASNPVLAAGEPGFELDTGKFKIGNGTDNWTALDYAGGTTPPTVADPTQPWSAVYAGTHPHLSASYVEAAAYGNGRWVGLGNGFSLTSSSANGEWSWNPFSSNSAHDLIYVNGLWVAIAGGAIVTTDNPENYSWTPSTESFGGANISKIAYHDGLWTLVTAPGDNSQVWTTNDPRGSWTAGVVLPDVNPGFWPTLDYLNGKWVVVAVNAYNEFLIYSATDSTSTWTLEASVAGANNIFNVGYSHEGYFISTYSDVWLSTTLDGSWTKKIDWTEYGVEISVEYGNGIYVAAGGESNGQTLLLTSTSLDSTFTPVSTTHNFEGFFSGIWGMSGPSSSGLYFNGQEWVGFGSVYDNISLEYLVVWAPPFTPPNLSALEPAKYDAGANSVSVEYSDGLRVNGAGELVIDEEAVASTEHSHLVSDPLDTWNLRYEGTSLSYLSRVSYGNGVWVAVGSSASLAPSLAACIVTAPSPDGPWTENATDFSDVPGFYDVAYGNGKWVAINDDQIWTATDPTGTWTLNTNVATGGGSVAYGNGVWAFFDWNTGIVYTTTTPDTYWYSNNYILDNIGAVAAGNPIIRFINSRWVIVGQSGGPTFYVLSSIQPWSEWNLEATFENFYGVCNIGWSPQDGYFVSTYQDVWSCKTLDGIWQQSVVWAENEDYVSLAYGGGKYVAVGTRSSTSLPIVLVSDSLNNTFEEIYIDPSPTDAGGFWYEPYYHDGKWIAVGSNYFGGTYEHSTVWSPNISKPASPLELVDGILNLNYGTGLTLNTGSLVPDFGSTSGKVAPGTHQHRNLGNPSGKWVVDDYVVTGADNAVFVDAAYADSRWVIVGYNQESYHPTNGFVLTKSDDETTWTFNEIYQTDYKPFYNVKFVNGTWVALCGIGNGYLGFSVYTATDPTGTWTQVWQQTWLEGQGNGQARLETDGTNLAIVLFDGRLYTTTSEDLDNWTQTFNFKTANSNIAIEWPTLNYVEDTATWVVSFNSTSTTDQQIWTTADVAGSWTYQTTIDDITRVKTIGYSPEGYYLDALYDYSIDALSPKSSVLQSSTLNGSWTRVINWVDDYTLSTSEAKMLYVDGKYVVSGTEYTPEGWWYARVLVSESLSGPFVAADIPDGYFMYIGKIVKGLGWIGFANVASNARILKIVSDASGTITKAEPPLTYSGKYETLALDYGTGLTVSNGNLVPDFGSTSGKVTQGNDSRLSDARTPTAHATSHGSAGSDPVTLANTQITGLGSASTKDAPATGDASASQVVLGSDTRLTNSRTPTAHKTSHSTGGTDALAPSDIGAASSSTSISTTSPLSGGGDLTTSRTLSIQDATTSQKGAVQLEDSTSSTSTSKAATPNSVKTAYDLANNAVPQSAVGSTVASLSGGKIPSSQIPAIAITDTFVVSSQSAMLALTAAETGDVAIRTDLSKSFILQGSDPTVLSNWKELLTPADAVTSVDGQTGVVSLTNSYAAKTHKTTHATGGTDALSPSDIGAVASSSLGTNVSTFLTTPSSSNLASAVTDETGSGSLVFANSPTLVTPALGTPSSITLTNATGLPVSTGISGLGTGVGTFLETPSSANLASAVTDETGTGSLVFGTSPTISTPTIKVPIFGGIQDTTTLGDNFELLADTTILRYTGTSTATLTGLAAAGPSTPADGRMLLLFNATGSFGITLTHAGSTSTAAYRLQFGNAGGFTLSPYEAIMFVYDASASRWKSTHPYHIIGNAGSATKLATARTIAGTSFDGTANINIDANNLSGTTLNSGITTSSLTSFGTSPTITTPAIDNPKLGYSTTATAAGTTALTSASNFRQYFTGTTTQTVTLPSTATLSLGQAYEIHNLSTGTVTVQSSGLNTVATLEGGKSGLFTCVSTAVNTAAAWDTTFDGATTNTGTGALVFGTSPTLTTPTLGVATATSINQTSIPTNKTLAVTTDKLSVFAPTSSSELAGVVSDETGSGALVFGTSPTLSTPTIDTIKMGFTSTATAAGSTTLTATSNYRQFFTGSTTQTVVLPVASTMATGQAFEIYNLSTGNLTINSSGGNLVDTLEGGKAYLVTCVLNSGTTAASWEGIHIGGTIDTGTGSLVYGTSPTLVTPTIQAPVLATVQAFTTTGSSNNVSLTTTASTFRYAGAAAATITGFSDGGTTPVDGRTVVISNASSFTLTLSNASASSTAAYRMNLPNGGDLTLLPSESVILLYDGTSSVWRAIAETTSNITTQIKWGLV